MLLLLPTSRAAFFVLANTLLSLSLSVHAFPLAQIYNEYRGIVSSTSTRPLRPRVTHIEIRTAGPTQAGIITHPPAKQAVLKAERPEPVLLPHSGLWTRGGLAPSTYAALDEFLVANNQRTAYYYKLSILGLGLHEHPDGLWKFFLHIDLAVTSEKEAKGHTKLPQMTASFEQPHPKEAGAYIIGDLMDFYELTEKDILEMIAKDEPAEGVMRFLSSRVSKMPGFSHKHVGAEEFDMVQPRTTTPLSAGPK
ncbi:hypothetical protein TWF696_004286 [Orbilia brochopaga]|uniref:Uncharacterized protein n=1 Tax=Orbilia brochopaga TaxID=3140254 RepID=A0AAV9V9I6_9PEZI